MRRILVVFLFLVTCCLPKVWGQGGLSLGENLRDGDPGTCATAVQFCSACGLDITATSFHPFENGPYYGCLNSYMSTYNNPNRGRTTIWFYLKIKDPGSLTISINSQSISGLFPDYCCWGPFNSKPTANQLTQSKLLNCDANNATNKTFTITDAQQDKFYIFALSFFYKKTSTVFNTISFEKIAGNATTYCSLIPVLNASSSALCQGESLVLEETNILDADQYNWTGPDGQTYSGRVWNRGSATVAMSGNYSCVVIRDNECGEANIDVRVTPQPNVTLTADETEICEGEEVTIHATVNFNQPDPGDILCTDGSIVKPSNWPCGKTAKGIVFYVDASGQHGWALGLTEQSSMKNWCVNQNMGYIPGITEYHNARDAIRDFNGKRNTQLITNPTNFPAIEYCLEQGGYLPSIGQLNVLYGELVVINNSLERLGLTTISDASSWMYWSSTVDTQTKVYRIDRTGQVISVNIKNQSNQYRARPLFDF